MNWSLLLSDALARLIGLLGLVASAAWIAGTVVGWPGAGPWAVTPAAAFGIGASVFCLMMTLFYLIPSYHDRMMRRTLRPVARVPFRMVAAAWCAVVVAGLFLAGAALDGVLGRAVAPFAWPAAAALAVAAALVLIYPGALAWREPLAEREMALRAERAARARAAEDGAEDGAEEPEAGPDRDADGAAAA